MYFSNAVAIALGRWVVNIDVIEPSFKTVKTRLRAAQGRSFFFPGGMYFCREAGLRSTFRMYRCHMQKRKQKSVPGANEVPRVMVCCVVHDQNVRRKLRSLHDGS